MSSFEIIEPKVRESKPVNSIRSDHSHFSNFAKLVMVDGFEKLVIFSITRAEDVAFFVFGLHIIISFC